MDVPSVRPDVLGRLLVIPNMLDVLPGIEAIAQFLESALGEVPGIGGLIVCVEDGVYPSNQNRGCSNCADLASGQSNPSDLQVCPYLQTPTHSIAALQLATSHHCYGYLMINVDDPQEFALYEPYIRNIANIVATVMENRAFMHELKTTNKRMNEVLEHLEQRVEDRTQGLQDEIAQREILERALRASEEKYRMLLATTLEGFWLMDADLKTIEVNEALCNLLDYHFDEWIGKTPLDFVAQDNYTFLVQQIAQILATNHHSFEIILEKKNGDALYTSINATTIRDQAGNLQGVFAFLTDISDRKRAEEKLQLAANVFTHAREGIMITNAEGIILEVNDAFTEITGYSRQEAIGRNPRFLKSDRQSPEFYAVLWHDLKYKGYWSGEIWNRQKSGELYAEMLTISAVRDRQGKIQDYVALFSNITAQKEHQQQLEHIAHYDALTHLPNRILLADRLHQAMAQVGRRGQQLAVVYLDLDGFKAINDTYGHPAGDQLLMTVALRMKQVLREGDTMARLGGDEFVAVLLDCTSTEQSASIFTRLLAAAAQPVEVGDLTLQVSASLGATFYPQGDPIDADQLLRQADQAMYQAKLAGKNRYSVFDAEQDRSMRDYHENLENIRQALRDQQFVLFYQPKVNMRTGEILGVEALIRWQHPQQGLVLPSHFLPTIENHPLSVAVGEWVIHKALTQLTEWRAQGLMLSVSVNVSAYHLQQITFMDDLQTLLAQHPNIQPHDLEIEVLETSALEDIAHVSQVIRACEAIGIRFALDDFGTGYSSLTYLKHLPIAQIKIDQSFVRNMLDDPQDIAILQSVIGLADALNRQVIAEGVETIAHGQMLLQLGCELAQGYSIAYPMPAADLLSWVKSWCPYAVWVQQRSVSRDDLPLFFADVEHRAWVQDLERCLTGASPTRLLPIDHHQCRFGYWLDHQGQSRYGNHPKFQVIHRVHCQIHTLAEEVLEFHQQGQNPTSPEKLNELYALQDALLQHLQGLMLAIEHVE